MHRPHCPRKCIAGFFALAVFGLQLAYKEVPRAPHRRRKWCRLPRGSPIVGFRDRGFVDRRDGHVSLWLSAPAGAAGPGNLRIPFPCSLTP